MPHQCTDCGRAFEDGSKEMLSGCPNCGGTTFQFRPEGATFDSDEPPEPPEPGDSVARTVGNAATAVRDLVVGGSPDSADDGSVPDDPLAMGEEDDAQANARSETIPPERLSGTKGAGSVPPEWTAKSAGGTASPAQSKPDELESDDGDTDTVSRESTDSSEEEGVHPADTDEERSRPDLSELREELNDQFESIRVIEPGQYELNLMELYDREEYIVALQEDGKYTIQVPDRWEA